MSFSSAQAVTQSSSTISDGDMTQSSMTVNRSSMVGAALLMKIEAPQNAQLSGTVKINGKIAGDLKKDRSISLAKCLQVSTCEVEVDATYNPNAAVDVSIYSTNGAMKSTQQSDGTGVLRQKFTVNLQ
jgi:hypothetical protein